MTNYLNKPVNSELDNFLTFLNIQYMKNTALIFLSISSPSIHSAQTQVLIETNLGDIPMTLFDSQAPQTVSNFLGYVTRGDYDNVIFHRLISGFVLQGGGYALTDPPETDLLQAITTQAPVQNEPGISSTRGTVAMAKLGGDPDSATSQWFVNLSDNSENLDVQNGGFTVFGEITDFTVVDDIESRPVINAGGSPLTTLPLVFATSLNDLERENFITINRISVIPEPSISALLSIVAGCALLRRRRTH